MYVELIDEEQEEDPETSKKRISAVSQLEKEQHNFAKHVQEMQHQIGQIEQASFALEKEVQDAAYTLQSSNSGAISTPFKPEHSVQQTKVEQELYAAKTEYAKALLEKEAEIKHYLDQTMILHKQNKELQDVCAKCIICNSLLEIDHVPKE